MHIGGMAALTIKCCGKQLNGERKVEKMKNKRGKDKGARVVK